MSAWRSRSIRHKLGSSRPLGTVDRPQRRLTKTAAMASLGSVVYAVRLDGGIVKIGCTGDLAGRIRSLRARERSTTSELLAFAPGGHATEQALHKQLRTHLAHGREYYRPTPEVMAVVNEMRRQLGLRPL